MTDEQIRQILIEMKREERKKERKAEIIDGIMTVLAWLCIFWVIPFMVLLIGG